MANYLPIYLSSSAKMWLMGLPIGPVHSWTDLCLQFIINFRVMLVQLGVEWDVANVVQKKGESLSNLFGASVVKGT
jgi:hypothetical protein